MLAITTTTKKGNEKKKRKNTALFASLTKPISMDHSKRNHDRIVVFLSLSCLLLLLWPEISLAEAQTPPNGQTESYNYNNNFSPSMAIIIVVLVAALFFMGFFSIWIRHCSDGSQTSIGGASLLNGGAGRSRRATRGLDSSVIETFPTLVYSAVKGLKIGKGVLECAVCLNEFEDDETLRLIPKCDHVFHPECIDTWLESHTTCPVCRANLVPDPDEPVHRSELLDIEAQNDTVAPELAVEQHAADEQDRPVATAAPELEVLELNKTLNRNRTRGSRSSRVRRLFPRSHSTGHSVVQPGENTERFTLRLPAEVRKEIMNRRLQRASSLVVLPREGSSRQGYRTGEGSSRGRSSRRLDRSAKSDRWIFSMTPPFFARTSSIKSPRVAANDDGEGTSASFVGPDVPRSDSVRPPV